MWPEKLIGRAGKEICPQGFHVDGGVCGVVNAINVNERAYSVGEGGEFGNGRHGADEVRCRCDRHQCGARAQQLSKSHGAHFAGIWIEIEPTDDGPHSLGGLNPGANIGVVVEPRDDDLIAGLPGG